MSDNMERWALTVTDAARLASVSRPTLYRWMKLSGFPVLRIGGVTRIPARAFAVWLESRIGENSEWGC